VRLGTGGEGGNFFTLDMNPLNFLLPPNRNSLERCHGVTPAAAPKVDQSGCDAAVFASPQCRDDSR
jgi:hypothetical protein